MAQPAEELALTLARVAARHSLPVKALSAMIAERLRQLGPSSVSEALLARKASDYAGLRTRLALPLGDDEVVGQRRQAALALGDGRFRDADKALALAERHALGGSADLAALPAACRVWAGETRADRGAARFLATMPDAYAEAAQRYGEASALIGLADPARSHALARAQVVALVRMSQDCGGRDGFDAAIVQGRVLLDGLDALVEPVDFAAGQAVLADAFQGLAELTGDEKPRIAAFKACRAGLDDLHRDEAPALWRDLQARLGGLALALGEARADEQLLEDAVTALAKALFADERARDQPDRLETEHRLAQARVLLGGWRGDLALLEAAFNGFNQIAAVTDRQRDPLRWAELQDAMGGVLAIMGERYSGTVMLEEAVAAFAAALEERRRETAPLLWATSSANQALASIRLASRRKDTELARAAVGQIAVAIEAMNAAGFTANADALKRRLGEAGALARNG